MAHFLSVHYVALRLFDLKTAPPLTTLVDLIAAPRIVLALAARNIFTKLSATFRS